MKKLTGKQQRFIEEYLIDLNATQAAIRAGYSKKCAEVQGHENLRKPNIAQAIAYAKEKRSVRTQVTADRVIEELAKLAFSNIKNLYDEKGDLLSVHELGDEVAASLQEVTEDSLKGGDDGSVTTVRRKYKLSDKKASLELLGRHLSIFTDNVNLNNKIQIVMDD